MLIALGELVWVKLLLIAGMIALVITAVRNPGVRPWIFGAAVCLVALFVVYGFRGRPMPDVDWAHPNSNVVVHSSRRVSVSVFGILLLPAIFGVVYMLVRKSRGQGGAGTALPFLGLLGLGVFAMWTSVRYETRIAPPVAVAEARHETARAEPQSIDHEPMDELWDRLNEPQIELSAPDAEDSAGAHDHAVEVDSVATEAAVESADADSDADRADDEDADWNGSASPIEQPDVEEVAAAASIAPATPAVEAAARPRPDWLDDPARTVGEIYRVPVQAGPHVRLQECYDELRRELSRATHEHVADVIRAETGSDLPFVNNWHISDTYIDRELLRDSFVETADTSVGPMQTVWALLEFTPAQDDYLVSSWKAQARQHGIGVTIALALVVLAVVGSVFALLQIDTWTRGYYSKRLFLGVPAAIIAVILFLAVAGA